MIEKGKLEMILKNSTIYAVIVLEALLTKIENPNRSNKKQ